MKKSLKAVLGVALVITLLATSLLSVLGATLVNVKFSTHNIGGKSGTVSKPYAYDAKSGATGSGWSTDPYQGGAYGWAYTMRTSLKTGPAVPYGDATGYWPTYRYSIDGRRATCVWGDNNGYESFTGNVVRYFWENHWPKARALYYFMPVWKGEYESFSDGTTTYYTSGFDTISLTKAQQNCVYNLFVNYYNNGYNKAYPAAASTYKHWSDVGYMAMRMAGIKNVTYGTDTAKQGLFAVAHILIDHFQMGYRRWSKNCPGCHISHDDGDVHPYMYHSRPEYDNACRILRALLESSVTPVPSVPAPVGVFHCYYGTNDMQTFASACFARVGIKVNKTYPNSNMTIASHSKYYQGAKAHMTVYRSWGKDRLGDTSVNWNYAYAPLRANGKDAYGGVKYTRDPDFTFGSDLSETFWVAGSKSSGDITLCLKEDKVGTNDTLFDKIAIGPGSSSAFSIHDSTDRTVGVSFNSNQWGTVQVLNLRNGPELGLLAIKKVSSSSGTTKPLPGATYSVYREYKGGTKQTGEKPAGVTNVYTGGTLSNKWGNMVSGTDGYAIAVPGLLGTYYIQENSTVSYNGQTYARDKKVYEVNLTPDYIIKDATARAAVQKASRTKDDAQGKYVFPSSSFSGVKAKTLVITLKDEPVNTPQPITLSLRKTTEAKDAFCDELSSYSLAGAEFGIYSNEEMTEDHRIGTIITDETGYTPEWTHPEEKLPNASVKVWLKELVAPKGHQINEHFNKGEDNNGNPNGCNSATIKGGESHEFICEDPVVRDPVELKKTDKDTGAALAGAVYKLTWIDDDGYYENHMDELEEDAEAGIYVPGKNVPDDDDDIVNQPFENIRTWYYETDVNGYWINNDAGFLASDDSYVSDTLFGETDNDHNLPLGAYTIQEVEAPDGYYLSPEIFTGRISDETKTYHVDATDTKMHKLSIKGNKIWNDVNDMDGIRPDDIYIQLYCDGAPVDSPLEIAVNDSDTTTRFEFNNLDEGYMVQQDVYDDVTGELLEAKGTIHYYDYVVVETNGSDVMSEIGPPEGYTPQYRSPLAVTTVNGNAIYNENVSQHPFMTSVGTYNASTGEVEWSDPVHAQGVYEGNVQIVNTHEPERVKLHVIKKWDDHNNVMNRRPSEISADVKWKTDTDGAVEKTITLKSSDNWEQTVDGLLKNFYGKVREWYLSETQVNGYAAPEISIKQNPNNANEFNVELTNREIVYPASVRKTDGAGNPLEGVTFELYCDSMPNSPVSYLKLNTETNKYEFVGFEAKDGASNVLTTDADGYINVADLPQGKWHFKETSTLSGKMIYDGDIGVEFTEDGQSLVSDGNGGTTEGNSVEVRNNNVIMPQTGGQGTSVFVALSLLCAAAAGVFILVAVKRRRMMSR